MIYIYISFFFFFSPGLRRCRHTVQSLYSRAFRGIRRHLPAFADICRFFLVKTGICRHLPIRSGNCRFLPAFAGIGFRCTPGPGSGSYRGNLLIPLIVLIYIRRNHYVNRLGGPGEGRRLSGDGIVQNSLEKPAPFLWRKRTDKGNL